MRWHDPILSCSESKAFEDAKFKGDAEKSARAMELAGKALGQHLLKDLGVRLKDPTCRCLLLLGKGNNAGDAIVCAEVLLENLPNLSVDVFFVFGESSLSGVLKSWWARFSLDLRVTVLESIENGTSVDSGTYDVSIDGIFGMQFRSPLSPSLTDLFRRIDALPIAVRIAVDLPSGMNDQCREHALRADFTYGTGIFKSPLMKSENLPLLGRIRYLDIGFFKEDDVPVRLRTVNHELLRSVKHLRPVKSDKRSYGHLLIVAGSRNMPGALMMAVQAALRSGVGLVTVLAPESVISYFAGVVPEAMWIPWVETPEGGLALEGLSQLQQFQGKFSAILMGPGCGKAPETQVLLDEIIHLFDVPVVLDADALTRVRIEGLKALGRKIVLTPHEGEFRRILGLNKDEVLDDQLLMDFAASFQQAAILLKGPLTRISDGAKVICFPMGNPILARGGSGDILAGLVSGKVAMSDEMCFFEAVACGVAIHGNAADRLFSEKEETHVKTTDILNFLNLY